MSTAVKLKLDGKDDVMQYVERVEYIEALDALDALVVEVRVPSHDDAAGVQKLIKLGGEWSVELQEDGKKVGDPGEGDILEVRHALRRRGGYQIHVSGLDVLHRLRGNQPAKVWEETSHADLIKEIAKRNKLTADVKGVDTTKRVIFEPDVSDAVFLRNLCREHHFSAHILKGKITFEAYKPAGAAVKVDWTDGVHELHLRACLDNMAGEAVVYGYDLDQEKAFEGKATSSILAKTSGGDTGVALSEKAFGKRKVLLHHAAYLAPTAAKARAEAELLSRADEFVRGTVVCEGAPAARAGRKLTIENAPWPWAGNFLIREVRHIQDRGRGYRTRIGFMSDSLPKA